MRVKDEFFNRGFFKLGNGETSKFGEDVWLGNLPPKHQYPSLFNLAQQKNITVHDVLMALHP